MESDPPMPIGNATRTVPVIAGAGLIDVGERIGFCVGAGMDETDVGVSGIGGDAIAVEVGTGLNVT